MSLSKKLQRTLRSIRSIQETIQERNFRFDNVSKMKRVQITSAPRRRGWVPNRNPPPVVPLLSVADVAVDAAAVENALSDAVIAPVVNENDDNDDVAVVENARSVAVIAPVDDAAPPAVVDNDPVAPPADNDPAVPLVICGECDWPNVATSTHCQICMNPLPPILREEAPTELIVPVNDPPPLLVEDDLSLDSCMSIIMQLKSIIVAKRNVDPIDTSNIINNIHPLPLPSGIAAMAKKAVGVDEDDFILSPRHNIFDKRLPTAVTTSSDPIGFWEKDELSLIGSPHSTAAQNYNLTLRFPKFCMAGNDYADVALLKHANVAKPAAQNYNLTLRFPKFCMAGNDYTDVALLNYANVAKLKRRRLYY
jgi:hypothetical protein